MRIIATMPGRFGDILWALPTVRALAERHDQPVELYVSKKYGDESFLALIEIQDYIKKAEAIETWEVVETAPMTPREPPRGTMYDTIYDPPVTVYHLGYESWPSKSLPYDISARAGVLVNLREPWINLGISQPRRGVALGWSPEWKELKWGLTSYLSTCANKAGMTLAWPVPEGSPYLGLNSSCGPRKANWAITAIAIATCRLFFGDLSAPWVLAVALGTPAVIVEPEPMRHNPIFWVDVKDAEGRRMTRMVMGNDEKPTFDWNHVADELKAAWEEFS